MQTILDAERASIVGHALVQAGGQLVRDRRVGDDRDGLVALTRTVAEALRELEGALGEFVLPRPRSPSVLVRPGMVLDESCGSSPPFLGASAACGPDPALLDGGD